MVEVKGFEAFVHKLDPTFVPPTRRALRVEVETKYKETKEKAAKDCGSSLTADMWTSVNMDAFLGVTCHNRNK